MCVQIESLLLSVTFMLSTHRHLLEAPEAPVPCKRPLVLRVCSCRGCARARILLDAHGLCTHRNWDGRPTCSPPISRAADAPGVRAAQPRQSRITTAEQAHGLRGRGIESTGCVTEILLILRWTILRCQTYTCSRCSWGHQQGCEANSFRFDAGDGQSSADSRGAGRTHFSKRRPLEERSPHRNGGQCL